MNPACSICLERFTPNCSTKSPKCGHVFHDRCILQSFRTKPECPVCRRPGTELCQVHLGFNDATELGESNAKTSKTEHAAADVRTACNSRLNSELEQPTRIACRATSSSVEPCQSRNGCNRTMADGGGNGFNGNNEWNLPLQVECRSCPNTSSFNPISSSFGQCTNRNWCNQTSANGGGLNHVARVGCRACPTHHSSCNSAQFSFGTHPNRNRKSRRTHSAEVNFLSMDYDWAN